MKQLDDVVGGVMAKLKADGLDKNTIVVFTTDNGTENFTWPDGGNTPFSAGKGTIMEGGMRAPMIARWPDQSRPERSRTASSQAWTSFQRWSLAGKPESRMTC